MRRMVTAMPALWLAAACSPVPTLNAYWTGTDTGRVTMPAHAALCGDHGPLLVFAQSGDTGIGLAIKGADTHAPRRNPH
jgi:hypothetical protein